MGTVERRTLTVTIFIACPFTVFVVAWWAAACLAMWHLAPIGERGIALLALAGLCVGVILAVWKVRAWVRRAYDVKWFIAATVFLVWSAVAICFFMGLPIANLAFGIAAGFYAGRRARQAGADTCELTATAKHVAMFTATVIACISLAMGILAVRDARTMQMVLSLVGCSRIAATWAGRTAVVAVAVPLIATAQYFLTRWAAFKAYSLNMPRPENAA
jgi:hypothetical protein